MKKIFIFLLFVAGCGPSSLEDFQHEGEAICRALVKDLQKIESREQLVKVVPRLKVHFEKLVDLMIEAKKFQETAEEEFAPLPTQASEKLLLELKRIYQLEAGGELIEKAQNEALLRLDRFEKSLQKKKSKVG